MLLVVQLKAAVVQDPAQMALGEMVELVLHQIFLEPQRNTAAAARQWASYQFRFMELRLVVAGYLPRTTQM
jgi:hypothetical protein